MEVRATDTLADNIPFRSTRDQSQLLLVHDIFQLLTYLTHLGVSGRGREGGEREGGREEGREGRGRE